MVVAWLIGADVSISADDLASEPLGRPPAGGLTSYDKVLPPFSTSSHQPRHASRFAGR